MFRFDFDIDDPIDDHDPGVVQDLRTNQQENIDEDQSEAQFREISIDDLGKGQLNFLPSLISCSPLNVSLRNGSKTITLPRRDLFDARFQLISEGTTTDLPQTFEFTHNDESIPEEKQHRHASALQFIEAPSDLIPRIYEGGLKTWECSTDLVEYLDSTQATKGFQGKHILELGCGTAVPTLYVLYHIFSSPPSTPISETVIYLQDYNDSVLELVTLPNIFLTWYLSPASQDYRASNATDTDADDLPFPRTPEPFELPISTSLKAAFLYSLRIIYNITICFFCSSWSSFSPQLARLHPQMFDIVLTSETIYRMDSLPSLVETMRLACCGSQNKLMEEVAIRKKGECLVAAKVLYFGVGGGVSDFVSYVEEQGIAKAEIVREGNIGIGRLVLSLNFII